MSNALFKKALQRITIFPPIFPPPKKRRLVRRTGRRPKYREYVTADVYASDGGGRVYGTLTVVREPDGSESYEYYEWVDEEPPAPIIRSPIVTPIAPAWDATARSGIAVVSPMAAEWVVGTGNVDMIVGLATASGQPEVPPAPPSGDAALDAINTAQRAADLRATILHGFRIVGNAVYVHTSAPPEFGEVAIELRYSSLPVTPGTVCRIEFTRGVLRYLVNDVVMATGPAYVYEGEAVHMRAALYGTGDSLEDPVLEALPVFGDAAVTLAPLGIKSGGGGDASLKFALWASGPRVTGVRATLGGLWALGGRVAGGSLMRISPFMVWGSGVQGNAGNATMSIGPIMMKGGDYAEAVVNMGLFAFGRQEVPPRLYGEFGLGSELAATLDTRPHAGAYANVGFGCEMLPSVESTKQIAAAVGLRSRARANYVRFDQLDAIMGFTTSASGQRVFDVVLVTDMGAEGAVVGVIIVSAQFDADMGAAFDIDRQRMAEAAMDAGLGVAADIEVQALYSEALDAVIGLGLLGVRDAADFLVWSVERGGASAAYSGFGFNSFARLGGRVFAASDAGLYELGGDDDNGTPIAAWVDLGQRDFGSTMLKGVSSLYLTASSDAKLVVRVTTPEGRSYTYRARSSSPGMRTHRVDLGRGLSATYHNLEITNNGEGEFDLEKIEAVSVESNNRRI